MSVLKNYGSGGTSSMESRNSQSEGSVGGGDNNRFDGLVKGVIPVMNNGQSSPHFSI